jgi:DNA processing protein
VVSEQIFWWAWSQVEGVGPITLKRIQAYFGDLASAWAANAIDLQAVEGIGSQTRHRDRPAAPQP